MSVDWSAIWGVVMPAIAGLAGWIAGHKTNKATTEATVERARADGASAAAETSVVTLMREEVKRLADRVGALETREGRLIRHIYRLEGLMRGAGLEPPHFDIDGQPEKAGGTSAD